MIIKVLNFTDFLCSNIYFYVDEKTKHGFLIDPGGGADEILHVINQNNWVIEKILLTHSHLDHLGAVLEISEKCKIPFFGLDQSKLYFSNPYHFTDQNTLSQMSFFKNGEKISLSGGSSTLDVLATPGHTLDSVCFYDRQNQVLFSGDTLFAKGVGRTDLEGGNETELFQSLKQILELPPQTKVYPGHGPATTIEAEKDIFS